MATRKSSAASTLSLGAKNRDPYGTVNPLWRVPVRTKVPETRRETPKRDFSVNVRRGEAPDAVKRALQERFGLEPGIDRSALLPLARNPDTGEIELTAPQLLYDAARALAAPSVILSGQPVDLESEAQNLALNFSGAGLGAGALAPLEGAALGMAGGVSARKLGVIASEYSPDIARRLDGLLEPDAPLAVWRDAADRLAGSAKSNVPPAPKAPAKALAKKAAKKPAPPKPAAPAIISSRSGTPQAVAKDVLREASKPSKGSPSYADWRAKNTDTGKLFDLSNLSAVPNVPQFQIQRVNPARGPSERIVDVLANPEVEQGINETVQRGIEGGGKEWYNTDPMLQRMQGVVPASQVGSTYARLMDLMAATSPRARVPDNVRTGTYYNYLLSQGMPVPSSPSGGYGSIAQKLHRDNVLGLQQRGGWDIFKNPKPASFSSNLQGNQQVATIDTHNFRLPGILSADPRFLETSIAELAKTPESAFETLKRQYPGLLDDIAMSAIKTKPGKVNKKGEIGEDVTSITYRPQEWVAEGYIPMEDAVNDPALWASKPRDNEYQYYEQWQQDQARKLGISPAQYQASMWLGGGEATGLGSAAEPFIGTVEARVRYTADRLGMDPETVLEMMLKGEIPLLAKGGAVDAKRFAVKRKARKAKKAQRRG